MGMHEQFVVYLKRVEAGKTRNWLKFYAHIGVLNRNQIYTLEFCGTELHPTLSLPEHELEQLRNSLCDDFGFPPYDISETRRILGEGKRYIVIRK